MDELETFTKVGLLSNEKTGGKFEELQRKVSKPLSWDHRDGNTTR